MFHLSTQRLIETWRGLRRNDAAPLRSAFDPCAFPGLMPQLFMLDGAADLPFRLAGGLIEDLLGRPLRGRGFLPLWSEESRGAVRDAARAVMTGREPAVFYASGLTPSGHSAGLELMLAPLAGADGLVDRLVGFCQPLTPLVRLKDETLVSLTHKLTILAAPEVGAAEPRLKLAAVDGRLIA